MLTELGFELTASELTVSRHYQETYYNNLYETDDFEDNKAKTRKISINKSIIIEHFDKRKTCSFCHNVFKSRSFMGIGL